MIKLLRATPAGGTILRLEFSDGTAGDFDFSELLSRDTSLTRPLREQSFLESAFIELGALCWPNGLEFSAESMYRKLKTANRLTQSAHAA